MQPLPRKSGNAPVLLLDRLQGQFLFQQKVLIFFYKMMFAQKVNLLFSYFVAVTVCRDQSKDCYKNEQKSWFSNFQKKKSNDHVFRNLCWLSPRKLIVDEVQAIEIVNINPWTEL